MSQEVLVIGDSNFSTTATFSPPEKVTEKNEPETIEFDTAQLKRDSEIEDFRSPASRRLLQAGGLAEHCYPTGECNLMDLMDGVSGFMLRGEAAGDQLGYRLKKSGDINGDGVDDLVMGAYGVNAGKSYVIFGNRTASAWGNGLLELNSLMNGQRGFMLQGEVAGDWSGCSVSSAGDINGDGVSDLAVGAVFADPAGRTNAGKTYVIFGNRSASGWGNGILDLSTLTNGIRGFVLQGEAGDWSGYSVSRAGDINGDGVDDLLVGALYADAAGRTDAGKSYVVFGDRTATAWSNGILDISSLMNGQRGFVLQGEAAHDYSGAFVSQAGDINGDSIDDLIVGAYLADPAGRMDAGKTYLVFGSTNVSAWGNGILDLSSLMNGQRGFVLQGEAAGDRSGFSVSQAGDINGDGVGDLLVGVNSSNPAGRINAGKSYVVFGSANPNAWGNGILDLSNLIDGIRGFVLQGEIAADFAGLSVSGGGDINQDGIPDILIGAIRDNISSGWRRSNTYVVYGTDQHLAWSNGTLDLSTLTNGKRGLFIQGASLDISSWAGEINGVAVSDLGDINSDGIDDFIRCCRLESPLNRIQAGSCYVVFGENLTPILVNNVLAIHSGEGHVISDINLNAADDQPFNHRLIYNISNVTRGQFEAVSAPSIAITQFKQANITAGQVRFVHDGSQIAPSYKISVSDGAKSSMPMLVNVTFYRRPSLNLSYNVTEGANQTLSSSHIQIIDDYPDSQVVLRASNIMHGQFILASPSTQNITQFTRAQLVAAQVSFQHDGSEFTPSYKLSLSDPYFSLPAVSSNITLIHVNDPPVLVRNRLNISQAQTIVLSNNELLAIDPDNTDDQLTFYVSNIQRGVFYVSSPTSPIYEFLQSNISRGEIHFVHDGSSALPPYYQVIVYDGQLSSQLQTVSVTFNGVNKPPTLLSAVLDVEEGHSTILTTNQFSATDADTPSEYLYFLISNVTHGQFERLIYPGLAIFQFSLQDVQENTIRFVHDDSEEEPKLDVAITDGVSTTSPRAAVINYLQVNNPPVLVNNKLSLLEGETVVLDSTDMSATDRDNPWENLIFTVSGVQQGQFELSSNPNISISSFSQQDVNSSSVRFVHDGGELAPTYAVSVNDGSSNTQPKLAQINFTNVDDAPIITSHPFTLKEGDGIELTSFQLEVTDVDTPASQVIVTPRDVQHGYFERVFSSNISISNFSAQDLQLGLIRFRHDGGEIAPNYTIVASDGLLSSAPSSALISFTQVDDLPILEKNQLTITEGETISLSSRELWATDPDNIADDLIFTLTNVQHGQFVSAQNEAVVSFNQKNISDGDIRFIHDGSNEAPSYLTTVSDRQLTTTPQSAAVHFTAVNDPPILETNTLSITQGEALMLNRQYLSANDEETPADALIFTIAEIQHGHFEYVKTGAKILVFSQEKIAGADIRFVTDGSVHAPSYTVQVSDGEFSSNKTSAIVNFNLAPSVFDTRDLISFLSTVGSISLTIGGYLWWRNRTAEHRRGHDFAEYMRKILNLEYYDFTKGQGEIYKTKFNNFINYINFHNENFYAKLTKEERQSFATCVASLLREKNLLQRSGKSSGLFNWLLCFSSGWSTALNLTEFEKQSHTIADTALDRWKKETNPKDVWRYAPYGQNNKWQNFFAAENCCPSQDKASVLVEELPEGKGELIVDASDIEMNQLPTSLSSSTALQAEDASAERVVATKESGYSPRLLGQRQRSSSTEERFVKIEQQLEQLKKIDQIEEGMKRLEASVSSLSSR